jgi:hypothetical protein
VIRGTVPGPDGKPLADAWVSVRQDLDDLLATMPSGGPEESRTVMVENRDDGGGTDEPTPALTDATGHFEITGLARTPWTVVAEAQAGRLRGRALRVMPDATITVQALGVTELHGIVHAAVPIEVFSVELDGPTSAARSFATADGQFAFDRVDPGAYVVRATSNAGNGEARVPVVAGQQASVEISLIANATVIGSLVTPAGKPLAGIPIAVVPDSPDGRIELRLEGPAPTSGPDGTFRIDAKAGPSALVVMVQPRPVIKRGLALDPGKTVDAGTITVDPDAAGGGGPPGHGGPPPHKP